MEIKTKNFSAPSRMERATKFFICILICLLITSINSIVFAESSMTVNEFEQIYFAYNGKELTAGQKSKIENLIAEYDYITVNTTNTGSEIAIRASDEVPTVTAYSSSLNRYSIRTGSPQGEIYTIFKNGTTQTSKGAANIAVPISIKDSTDQDAFQNFTYLPDGADNTIDNFNFYPGWMNVNIEIKYYLEPYFEWAGEKVATTTLENFDGNIPCFYPNSFKNYANSYMSYKRIGYLYIDENYTLDKVYYGFRDFTIYNMEQTKSWTYQNDAIFVTVDEYKDGYAVYKINIELKYINTPYIYTMDFISRDVEFGQDINVDFILLNDPNQETTGPIITPSGDILPGEGTTGGTTTGDIENTLNEPYNPNQNILNNMNSGDILENLGYQVTEDPNADLWDTIINGLKQTLTGKGNVTLELPLRTKTVTVNSNQIKQPENELKFFTGLFVNFWLLMQMFTFIKKTIDQINEGNLKVMHDVDADCYFF